MSAFDSTASHPKPARTPTRRWGKRPGAWALLLAWLCLLALPLAGLFNPELFGAISLDAPPAPWMPTYPPIP